LTWRDVFVSFLHNEIVLFIAFQFLHFQF
jgi:hypothetical protein